MAIIDHQDRDSFQSFIALKTIVSVINIIKMQYYVTYIKIKDLRKVPKLVELLRKDDRFESHWDVTRHSILFLSTKLFLFRSRIVQLLRIKYIKLPIYTFDFVLLDLFLHP